MSNPGRDEGRKHHLRHTLPPSGYRPNFSEKPRTFSRRRKRQTERKNEMKKCKTCKQVKPTGDFSYYDSSNKKAHDRCHGCRKRLRFQAKQRKKFRGDMFFCVKCYKEKPLQCFILSRNEDRTLFSEMCSTCYLKKERKRQELEATQKDEPKKEAPKKEKKKRPKVNTKKTRARRKEELFFTLLEYFKQNPCVDCGEANPLTLEFDHIDPETKTTNVSKLIHSVRPWEEVLEEIEKCEVRCASCHRVRTHHQRKTQLLRLYKKNKNK